MSEKKKENQSSVNGFLLIVFWVLLVGLLDNLAQSIFFFSSNQWIAAIGIGLIKGLIIGTGQSLAIRFLFQKVPAYWIRLNILSMIIFGLIAPTISFFAAGGITVDTFYQYHDYLRRANLLLLIVLQWQILRQEFRQAWVWLLLILPNLFFEQKLVYESMQPYFQALFSALALLWMNYQTSPEEKAKASEEAEARLADFSSDEEEFQDMLPGYQLSEG